MIKFSPFRLRGNMWVLAELWSHTLSTDQNQSTFNTTNARNELFCWFKISTLYLQGHRCVHWMYPKCALNNIVCAKCRPKPVIHGVALNCMQPPPLFSLRHQSHASVYDWDKITKSCHVKISIPGTFCPLRGSLWDNYSLDCLCFGKVGCQRWQVWRHISMMLQSSVSVYIWCVHLQSCCGFRWVLLTAQHIINVFIHVSWKEIN